MVRSRQLSLTDQRTLLRLMSDGWYQEAKLGGAFPPAKQQRSSGFWQLAAAYLEQPLLVVMLAGGSLRAGAGGWAGLVGWRRACSPSSDAGEKKQLELIMGQSLSH